MLLGGAGQVGLLQRQDQVLQLHEEESGGRAGEPTVQRHRDVRERGRSARLWPSAAAIAMTLLRPVTCMGTRLHGWSASQVELATAPSSPE